MTEILATITSLVLASSMKKDYELPWYLRILRWTVVCFAVAYSFLLVAEKAKEVF